MRRESLQRDRARDSPRDPTSTILFVFGWVSLSRGVLQAPPTKGVGLIAGLGAGPRSPRLDYELIVSLLLIVTGISMYFEYAKLFRERLCSASFCILFICKTTHYNGY